MPIWNRAGMKMTTKSIALTNSKRTCAPHQIIDIGALSDLLIGATCKVNDDVADFRLIDATYPDGSSVLAFQGALTGAAIVIRTAAPSPIGC